MSGQWAHAPPAALATVPAATPAAPATDGDDEKRPLAGHDHHQQQLLESAGDMASRTTGQCAHVGVNGKSISKNASVDDVLDFIGFGRFQWRMLVLTGLCWMADAAEMTVLGFLTSSGALETDEQIGATPFQADALSSVVFVGMWIGLSGFGVLADQRGRRISYVMSLAIILVFGVLSAFSPNYAILLIMRIIVGIGVGGAGVAITMFSEFLPAENRGTFSIYIEAFWTVGTLVGTSVAWVALTQLTWRWMIALASMPPLLGILFFPWLPESPRQLLLMGHREKATELLYNAARENGVELPEGILLRSVADNVERGRVMDLFAPGLRRTTLILFALSFVNCFAYYGLVFVTPAYFAPAEQSGSAEEAVNENLQYLQVMIISAAEFPGIVIAAYMINKAGRKWTQAILLTITGIFSILLIFPSNPWLQMIFASITRMCILGAYATLLVVYIEAFPTRIRATGVGVCGSFARIAGIITPLVAGIEVNGSLVVPLSVYAAFAIAAGGFATMLPRETTGASLDDIDAMDSRDELGKALRDGSSTDDSGEAPDEAVDDTRELLQTP